VRVTDESGIELDKLVYQEVICVSDSSAASLSCTCRVGADPQFSFDVVAEQQPDGGACEDLVASCDARSRAERADGQVECDEAAEFFGHDTRGQGYTCSVPISMGGLEGLALVYDSLECAEEPDGSAACVCHDDFSSTDSPLETTASDFASAWELAVSECEALLEAAPSQP
jgi:hypothetical protein